MSGVSLSSIAAFMAVMVVVILLLIEFLYILPESLTSRETSIAGINVYELIESRGNWTAPELVEAIISRYNPEYVNVSIKVYDILMNDTVVYSDRATYKPVNITLDQLIIYKYVFTKLYRSGHYVEYLIEVGFK